MVKRASGLPARPDTAASSHTTNLVRAQRERRRTDGRKAASRRTLRPTEQNGRIAGILELNDPAWTRIGRVGLVVGRDLLSATLNRGRWGAGSGTVRSQGRRIRAVVLPCATLVRSRPAGQVRTLSDRRDGDPGWGLPGTLGTPIREGRANRFEVSRVRERDVQGMSVDGPQFIDRQTDVRHRLLVFLGQRDIGDGRVIR